MSVPELLLGFARDPNSKGTKDISSYRRHTPSRSPSPARDTLKEWGAYIERLQADRVRAHIAALNLTFRHGWNGDISNVVRVNNDRNVSAERHFLSQQQLHSEKTNFLNYLKLFIKSAQQRLKSSNGDYAIAV